MDAWTLTQDKFSSGTAMAFEGLFALSSGYLQTRASFEEHVAGTVENSTVLRRPANVTAEAFAAGPSKWGTYVPGVSGHHPPLLQEMINLPSFLELAPTAEGQRLTLSAEARVEISIAVGINAEVTTNGFDYLTDIELEDRGAGVVCAVTTVADHTAWMASERGRAALPDSGWSSILC